LLPADFALLGFARRDWGDGDFAALAKKAAKTHARTQWNDDVWRRLNENLQFVPGSFDDDQAFDTLAETLDNLRNTHGIKGNAAFYLSIPPAMFPVVLKQMDRTGMASNARSGGWRRVVVEKPFGHDLESARELNELVDSVFTANDVFRIDHYLGKETVQNLMALRFANQLFEPIWNSHYVDSVQITMAEDVGIGGRAAFYDATGAARDVLQNHLLNFSRSPRWRSRSSSPRRRSAPRRSRCSGGEPAIRSRRRRHPRSVRPGLARWAASQGLPRRGWHRGRLEDRDLRCGTAWCRDAPMGRRAVLYADGQAPSAPGHRDRDPVQEGTAPTVQPH
jgi:hypothetical protein